MCFFFFTSLLLAWLYICLCMNCSFGIVYRVNIHYLLVPFELGWFSSQCAC